MAVTSMRPMWMWTSLGSALATACAAGFVMPGHRVIAGAVIAGAAAGCGTASGISNEGSRAKGAATSERSASGVDAAADRSADSVGGFAR
jgi:hypothetical protein